MYTRSVALAVLVAASVLVGVAGCGGGGEGFRVPNDMLRIVSTALPPTNSGERIDYAIDLKGGCGGPYVMSVVEGRMPQGVTLNEETHSLEGYLLEDGSFSFKLQVSDTGCTPFQTTTATYGMNVGVGALSVVQATLDGVPGMIRPGEPGYDTTLYGAHGAYPAIPAVVYGSFATIVLQVAGGVAPYEASVLDDPGNPNDGPLPMGATIPKASTSIVGSPSEVGAGGGPFLVTVRVKDQAGQEALFTFYWLIRTPPIVIATESLGDGVCGQEYKEAFLVVDGVPPFRHLLSAAGPGVGIDLTQTAMPDTTGDVVYDAPNPPTVPDPGMLETIDATWYPGEGDTAGGTLDYRTAGFVTAPEGLRLDDERGILEGVPRRMGTFRIHYHVVSSLVPNNYGQQNWRTFDFSFSEAPAFAQDPAYTVPGSFEPAPYAFIEEASQGKSYNPDGGDDGLQLLATGGVVKDGWTDAPLASQSVEISGTAADEEQPGTVDWTVDYDPDGDGGASPIPAMELAGWIGVWRTVPDDGSELVKHPPQELAFTAVDQQLPTLHQHRETRKVRFGVGPDVIVITRSTTPSSVTSYPNFDLNDPNVQVSIVEMVNGTSTWRGLETADLTGEGANRHGIPATAGSDVTLGNLLQQVDIARVSINPTGWWQDNHNLNPTGARSFQHCNSNRYYTYYGVNYVYYNMGSTTTPGYYSAMVDVSAVELPKARHVTENHATGIYTDGGKLYVFDSQDYFGVFVVRRDSRIYVPAAFHKNTYASFGDNWAYTWTSSATAQNHSLSKIAQMTVSPDGRFAAMKLRRSASLDQWEKADTTDVLVFSLAGERLWGGKTYAIVETGASGTSSTGEVLFASSLSLTDEYLYYLVGNSYGGSWYYSSWKDHFIYRYEILGGASEGARLSSSDMDWANTSGNPMQTPFQVFNYSFLQSTGIPSYAMVQTPGYNSWEGSLAPHPFRVSADGKSCAILAGKSTPYTADSSILQHNVWVDTGGTLYRLSSHPRRHPHGGGRGYGLLQGPAYFNVWQYGTFTGPTTAFEISDDGSRVAAVYNTNTGYAYHDGYYYWWRYPENVIAYSQANGSDWSGGANEYEVTSPFFTTSIRWRYGALVFTKDGEGLVFWGGYSSWDPTGNTTYNYVYSSTYVGSLYGFKFSDPSGVYSLLTQAMGGRNAALGTKYTSSNVNTPSTSRDQIDGGVIKPLGGFLSMNREFFYLVNGGSLHSSGGANCQLVGVNIRSANTAQSINGHTDFRGFKVGGQDSRHGFVPDYTYYYSGVTQYYAYLYYWYQGRGPGGMQGAGQQIAAADNGWIFNTTYYQYSGPAYYSSSYVYGGPLNPTYYNGGYYGCDGTVDVFDPNVGGDKQNIVDLAIWNRSTSSLTSADYRPIEYIEVSPDGSTVGISYRTYYYYYDRDRVAYAGGIQLDPTTGALLTGHFFVDLVSSNARNSRSMTIHAQNHKLYVARGTGNENNKTMYEYAPSPGVAGQSDLGLGVARFNVLNAAR